MKNLFVIACCALIGLNILGCSKGNPKNTDLGGDKYRKLIVGKWELFADTTLLTVDGTVVKDTKTSQTNEFIEFKADGAASKYDGTALTYNFTYKIDSKTLTMYIPEINSGGLIFPAITLEEPIRTLNDTDLILHHDVTLDVEVNGVKQKSRSVQTMHFKRR